MGDNNPMTKEVVKDDEVKEDQGILEWEEERIEVRSLEADETRFVQKPVKRKTTTVKEDDLKKDAEVVKKRKTELPPIREGCWGEYNHSIVVVAGVQPYIPKPQRLVGRRRGGKVVLNPLTRPVTALRSQDIRLFVRPRPRADALTVVTETNSVSQVPAFEEGGGDRILGGNTSVPPAVLDHHGTPGTSLQAH